MQNFIITLLICSVVMSALALVYMAATPYLEKRYSTKWRYYAWLIILVGLIIPFRPQFDFALFRVEIPSNVPPSVVQTYDGAPSYLFPPTDLSLLPPVGSISVYAMSSNTGLSSSLNVWQIAMVVWLAGVMAFIAYHGIKYYRFIKVTGRWSEAVTDEYVLSLLENLKSQMGITKQIQIYLCRSVCSPMMIGLINPRILLPTVEQTQDELCFILKHELVHYKRKDLLYKYLVLVATTLHWFNPIVYLIAKAINVQCETSCDAEVLRSADMNTRQIYGETIIGVVKYQAKMKTVLSTNFYGGKRDMTKRISSIMDTKKKKAGIIIAAIALILAISTGLILATTTPAQIEENIYASNEAEVVDKDTSETDIMPVVPIVDIPAQVGVENRTSISHEIEVPEKDMQFVLRQNFYYDDTPQSFHISFEEAAKIAAETIYQEFGVSIDGMTGNMIFLNRVGGVWSGFIDSVELTAHSCNNALFHFIIRTATGEVTNLYMNTPETPFFG